MRKHSVRKWIHAILDLLPLLVIPIFAINIINRSVEPIEVSTTYDDVETIDFNQLCNFNNSSYSSSIVNTYELNLNGAYSFVNFTDFIELDSTHTYYLKVYCESVSSSNALIYIPGFISSSNFSLASGNNNVWYYSSGCQGFRIRVTTYSDYQFNDYYFKCNLFDLTKMFGVGNEPSKTEFESYFGQYYEYTVHRTELLNKGTVSVIYNDTDIGSQFVYSLYHVTDKYFNMNDTFNLAQVYEWFTTNIFGGNPPLVVPIVWNIIIYEFIMDLLFLLYAVFMFVIDFAESFMERMFDKARCGGK